MAAAAEWRTTRRRAAPRGSRWLAWAFGLALAFGVPATARADAQDLHFEVVNGNSSALDSFSISFAPAGAPAAVTIRPSALRAIRRESHERIVVEYEQNGARQTARVGQVIFSHPHSRMGFTLNPQADAHADLPGLRAWSETGAVNPALLGFFLEHYAESRNGERTVYASGLRVGVRGAPVPVSTASTVSAPHRGGGAAIAAGPALTSEEYEAAIAARIIGQRHVIRNAMRARRRAAQGLSDPRHPQSGLSIGPTGTGKTELTRIQAELDGDKLLVLNMGEFSGDGHFRQLLGAPAGSTESAPAGQLTEFARANPTGWVVFDEVEKANPNFWDLMLGILGAGRVTDSLGNEIDVSRMKFRLTSNAGKGIVWGRHDGRADQARDEDDEDGTDEKLRERLAAATGFRLELLNRLGSIDVFDALSEADVRAIVALRIEDVQRRLAPKNMRLRTTAKAQEWLAARGYSEALGARPLERLIESAVTDAVAEGLELGHYGEGDALRAQVETFTRRNGKVGNRVVIRRDDDPTPETDAPAVADRRDEARSAEAQIAERVRGQRRGVRRTARMLRATAAGMQDPEKPASVLLAGPRGVGKSTLAKAVGDASGGRVLTLEMSEFATAAAIHRLTGSPHEHAGAEHGEQLVDAVRADPELTVVFDDIEKAHPEVQSLLRQIVDKGRLVDGKGRTVDFRRTKIVVTTRAGHGTAFGHESHAAGSASSADESMDDPADDRAHDREARAALARSGELQPELIDSFDQVTVLDYLAPGTVRHIARTHLDALRRLPGLRGMGLHVSDKAEALIAELGHSREFGAREMQRTVHGEVGERITDGLLDGHFREGAQLRVQVERGRIAVRADDDTTPEDAPHASEHAPSHGAAHPAGHTSALRRTSRPTRQSRSPRTSDPQHPPHLPPPSGGPHGH